MDLSEKLGKISVRAKEAEARAAVARSEVRADLEREVTAARASSQARAEELRDKADASRRDVSNTWADVQKKWNEHIATIRADIDTKKTQHDVATSEKRAERSELDALDAIDFAVGAIEEAEYEVLQATLARMEADDLAAAGART